MGHGDDEPHEGPPRRGAPLSGRRRFLLLVVAVVGVAGLWVGGGVLLIRQIDRRHASLTDVSVERAAAPLHEQQAALLREASLLAQDPALVDGVQKADWATLARGAARLRALTLERIADVVVVTDAAGAPLLQIPATPRVDGRTLAAPAKARVGIASLEGSAYLLAVAAVGGDAARGVVVVGRRAERLDPPVAGTGLVVLDGDVVRYSTLGGAPAIGWEAATTRGAFELAGEPWLLRSAGRLGGDAVWVAVRDGDAAAERRFIVRALGAAGVLAALAVAGLVILLTRRPSRAAQPGVEPATIAVEHARLVREASEQTDRMRALAELSRVFAGTLDPAIVSERIADCVRRLFPSVSAALFRVERVSGDLVPVATSSGRAGLVPPVPVLPRGIGISGLAAETRRLVVSTDVVADPRIRKDDVLREWNASVGHYSAIALPLIVNDDVVGVLSVSGERGRVFGADDMRVAQMFGDQAALALANARLYAESAQRRAEAEELARLAQTLTESLEVSEVAQRTVDSVLPLFRVESSIVRLLQADGSLTALAVGGRSREHFATGHVLAPGVGVLGRAVVEGAAVAASDALAHDTTDVADDLAAGFGASGELAVLAVPMRAKGVIIGALGVADRRGRVFTDGEIALLQAFADQATLALENARLFAVERTRREQIGALADIERELAAVLDPERLPAAIVERATALFKASGALYILEDGVLERRAWTGADVGHDRLAPGEGFTGLAVRERRGLLTNDYARSPQALPNSLAAGVRSTIVQPLVLRDRALGALAMSRTGDDTTPFTVEDLALLQSFAAHAATATENARLYAEATRYAERLQALEEVNRLVSASLEPEEVLGNLARTIAQFFDAPYVSVWSRDDATGRLRRAVTHGDVALGGELHHDLAPGEGAVGWVVEHREPILWTDVASDSRMIDAAALLGAGFSAFTAYPIAIGDRVLGAFAVHRTTSAPATPETSTLMRSLAAQAAVALENARLYSATARQLTQTRALLEVAAILNSTLEARPLLKRLAIKVAQVCGVDRCAIERWEGDRSVPLMAQFADGRKAPAMWEEFLGRAGRLLREAPINTRAIETRRPVIVDDASDASLTPPEWVEIFALKSYMTVPIVRQDDVIGVLRLDYCERRRPFAPWQVDLATAVAGQIALALDNTRLYAEAQERLRETSTLLAIGRVFSETDAGPDVMRRVAAELARAFGADMVGAYLVDERKERLLAVGGYHVPKDLLAFFQQRPIVLAGFPWVLDGWRRGRAVWSSDVPADPGFDPDWVAHLPPHSVLFAPTLAHGEAVGGLFLVWWQPGRVFDPAEVRLVEGVAAQVGLAMENAELARQTRAKLSETQTLLSVSRALSSTLDLQGLLRHFLRTVASTLGAECVGSWLVQDDGEWMEPVAGYRIPPERLAAYRGFRISLLKHTFYAEAARTKRPAFTNDAMNDSRMPAFVREQGAHRTQLFVPVVVNDRMIAAFSALWWETARDFSDDELALVEAIAAQAAVALENGRLFAENRRRLAELSVLHDLSRAVTGELDRGAVVDAVRDHVRRVLDARNMSVVLRDAERGDLEVALRVTDGDDDAGEPRRYAVGDAGLASVVLATGRALRTDDDEAECARQGVRAVGATPGLPHWLGVPMIAGDQVLGAIALRGARPFAGSDEQLLLNIAHLAALALRSVRLYDERARTYRELAAAQDQLVRTEKLRAMGEMASGVAHDFNNLLAAILGRAQLLMRHVEDPQHLQGLRIIERSALDGAQTVRRLQEFTRIRRDQPMVAVDLTQVVRDALDITQSRWRDESASQGIPIEVRTNLAAVPPILGDAAELREALTNLILNAVDAMPTGGVLTLLTRVEREYVEVVVQDTGVGIPAAVRDKIFDPFFTTKGPQGTGLGLSLTYGIVSRHGGYVSVDSDEGRGSTFRLVFPSADTVEPTPAAPSDRPAEAAPTRTLRCLVVDDEDAVRAMLGDAVDAIGHHATVVEDGTQAIARFRAEPFDVVITDLAMPGISGWQVARAVKHLAAHVYVILVTGFGVEVSSNERRAYDVDLVLVKPLQIDDIRTALAAVARRAPQGPSEDTR